MNGQAARAVEPNFARWEITVRSASPKLAIRAEDISGNVSSVTLSW